MIIWQIRKEPLLDDFIHEYCIYKNGGYVDMGLTYWGARFALWRLRNKRVHAVEVVYECVDES